MFSGLFLFGLFAVGRAVALGDGQLIRCRDGGDHPRAERRPDLDGRDLILATHVLLEEAAIALGAFRDDPAGMVAACRRIIDRQLACGPLWWLCARILCGTDPMAEARAAVTDMEADPTARCLAAALPDDATVVVVGACAATGSHVAPASVDDSTSTACDTAGS